MEDADAGVAEHARRSVLKYLVALLIYVASWHFLGKLGVIVVTIIGMFLNTSSVPRGEGQLSAYGILNPGRLGFRGADFRGAGFPTSGVLGTRVVVREEMTVCRVPEDAWGFEAGAAGEAAL
ncbi:hypothetical protein OIY81_3565 [Cryptosporidium canis]|nr:hypothetical protein OIY81_3565 [Cryptosporidium canis]